MKSLRSESAFVFAPVQPGTFCELLEKVHERDPRLAAAIESHLKSELASALEYNASFSKEGKPHSETWMQSNAELCFVVEGLLYEIFDSKSALSLCDGDILIHAGRDRPTKALS